MLENGAIKPTVQMIFSGPEHPLDPQNAPSLQLFKQVYRYNSKGPLPYGHQLVFGIMYIGTYKRRATRFVSAPSGTNERVIFSRLGIMDIDVNGRTIITSFQS